MNDHDNPQDVWKRNDPGLPQPPTTAEICALARRRVQEDVWLRRIGVLVLAGSAIGYAHNTWEIQQPWVRLGQGWMLIVITVFLFGLLLDRTGHRASNETCEGFLLRSTGTWLCAASPYYSSRESRRLIGAVALPCASIRLHPTIGTSLASGQ